MLPGYVWWVFGVSLAVLLVIDLAVHRHGSKSRRDALIWTVVWIVAGLSFGVFVWVTGGAQMGKEYYAAFLIEKSLSLDNIFVFYIVFTSLNVPEDKQRVPLTWGVFGALVFRGLFIFIGVRAIERWHWIVYVFGGVLILAAIHAFREDPTQPKDSRIVHWLSHHVPVTKELKGDHFVLRRDGRLLATPLLLALVAIELTDIVFAIDSVPAALSVSREELVVYSSNAFAILGLRALYILLVHVIQGLRYLHYGLAAVLAFAGLKMITSEWFEVPPLASIAVIVVCIGASVLPSLRRPGGRSRRPRGKSRGARGEAEAAGHAPTVPRPG